MKTMVCLFAKTMALVLASLIYVCSAAAVLPDTVQTQCYDDNGTVLDPCPSPGEPFYGQDGSYTINPPAYTKLDDSGAALPDDAASWAMVRDDVTGLVWENKQTAMNGTADYTNPNDPDNTYTWYDGATGTPRIDNDTRDFIEALNTERYGGHDDWRLPTPHELMTIVLYGQPSLSIDTSFFSGTKNAPYWTATTSVTNSARALGVSFSDGAAWFIAKSEDSYARAVRGAMPSQTLIDNGDGTVTDNATGLMWQQDLDTTDYLWATALDYCEGLELAGYTDWRSPTIKELYSIINYSQANPAITPGFFTGLTENPLSSTSNISANYSYNVYRNSGGTNWFQKTTTGRAWAVRSEWPGFSISACTVTPELLNPGTEATITCAAATDNGSIVEYRWDFGADGMVDNITSGSSIGATYAAAGAYAGKVIAENTGGQNAGRNFTVRVVDCIDADGDSYGDNCSAGPDCNDGDAAAHAEHMYYQDADGDTYGNAAISTLACGLPAGYVGDSTDCDDTDPDLHDNCTTCTIALKPATMSKLLSFFFPVRRIVITAQQAAVFPVDPAIDWGTDSIETVSTKRKNDTTILAWVRIKPRLLEIDETYEVMVGDCTGALSIRGF